jgi:hypothetical protein
VRREALCVAPGIAGTEKESSGRRRGDGSLCVRSRLQRPAERDPGRLAFRAIAEAPLWNGGRPCNYPLSYFTVTAVHGHEQGRAYAAMATKDADDAHAWVNLRVPLACSSVGCLVAS